MIKKILSLIASLAALVLEILPFGAVLNFADPEGGVVRKTYSYFSLVPYGYANFFPLFTAILSVLLFAFLLFSIIAKSEKAESSAFYLSFAAVLLSLCPLFYGIRAFSICGLAISICLFLSAFFLWNKERMK